MKLARYLPGFIEFDTTIWDKIQKAGRENTTERFRAIYHSHGVIIDEITNDRLIQSDELKVEKINNSLIRINLGTAVDSNHEIIRLNESINYFCSQDSTAQYVVISYSTDTSENVSKYAPWVNDSSLWTWQEDSYQIELKHEYSSDDIVLAELTYNGSTLTVSDLRYLNVYRIKPSLYTDLKLPSALLDVRHIRLKSDFESVISPHQADSIRFFALQDKKVYAKIRWNDTGTHSGGVGQLTKTGALGDDDDIVWDSNEWIGYKCYIHGTAKEYDILSNSDDTLSLDTSEVVSSGTFTIHTGCKFYDVRRMFKSCDSSGIAIGDWIHSESNMAICSSPPEQMKTFRNLIPGEYFKVTIYSYYDFDTHSAGTSGEFTLHDTVHPPCEDTITNLTMIPIDTGCTLAASISPIHINEVAAVQFAWSFDGSDPSFGSSSSSIITVDPGTKKAVTSVPADIDATIGTSSYNLIARYISKDGRHCSSQKSGSVAPKISVISRSISEVVNARGSKSNLRTAVQGIDKIVDENGGWKMNALSTLQSYGQRSNMRINIIGPESSSQVHSGNSGIIWEDVLGDDDYIPFTKSSGITDIVLACQLFTDVNEQNVEVRVGIAYPSETDVKWDDVVTSSADEASGGETIKHYFNIDPNVTGRCKIYLQYRGTADGCIATAPTITALEVFATNVAE